MSDLDELLIDKTDFECVGNLAKHCDWEQLCVYIREQQNTTIIDALGDCLYLVLMNNLTDETVLKILNGTEYDSCSGAKALHYGLKRVLVHYSYGAYMYRHGFIDTPSGVKQKISEYSLPAPLSELKDINLEQKNIAYTHLQRLKNYLCVIRDESIFDDCNCNCESRNHSEHRCDSRCSYCKDNKIKYINRGTNFDNIRK